MILFVVGIIVIFVLFIIVFSNNDKTFQKEAGCRGEKLATNIIKSVLKEGDYLYTNVSISYNGKKTELDNVVVNKYGVFIFEVKNYNGKLIGEEDDYTWKKYKDDGYGNIFVKEVKNPIKQVKRQIYILARYLNNFNVWVEGYAIILYAKGNIKSEYLIKDVKNIDKAIHSFKKNRLSKHTVVSIGKALEKSLKRNHFLNKCNNVHWKSIDYVF